MLPFQHTDPSHCSLLDWPSLFHRLFCDLGFLTFLPALSLNCSFLLFGAGAKGPEGERPNGFFSPRFFMCGLASFSGFFCSPLQAPDFLLHFFMAWAVWQRLLPPSLFFFFSRWLGGLRHGRDRSPFILFFFRVDAPPVLISGLAIIASFFAGKGPAGSDTFFFPSFCVQWSRSA